MAKKKIKTIDDLRAVWSSVTMEQGQLPAPISYLPTGIKTLDLACGGGFPRGHYTVVWGLEGTGKTGLMTYPALSAQRHPVYAGQVVYIATEPKVNLSLFSRFGVDLSKLTVIRTLDKDVPITGEMIFEILKDACGVADFIIVDSVPNIVPGVVYNVGMDDATPMAATARLLSAKLPTLVQILSATKTSLVFINHVRSVIDAHSKQKEKQYGGYPIRQQAALTVKLGRIGTLPNGFKVKATVQKQSLYRGGLTAVWDLNYDTGIDMVLDAYEAGKTLKVINPFSRKVGDIPLYYEDSKKDTNAALDRLRAEPDLLEWLCTKIDEAIATSTVESVATDEDDSDTVED